MNLGNRNLVNLLLELTVPLAELSNLVVPGLEIGFRGYCEALCTKICMQSVRRTVGHTTDLAAAAAASKVRVQFPLNHIHTAARWKGQGSKLLRDVEFP